MKFSFDNRSYSGKTFRPRPEVHIDDSLNLLIVATPWGPRAPATKIIERMREYLTLAQQDRQATSPFDRISCLSDTANNLRTAALLANEFLFRHENREEYRSGVEIFAACASAHELVWLQVGQPQIVLLRQPLRVLPLGGALDLSSDISSELLLPPLPGQMLGLDTSVNMSINSFRLQEKDRLLLLSHSDIPQELYNLSFSDYELQNITQHLATKNPDLGFWLGLLKIEDWDE